MRRLLPLLTLFCVLTSCQDADSSRTEKPALAAGKDDGTVQRYKLQGVVVRRDDAKRVVTIKHGPVVDEQGKVWMEAMTMDFPVPGEQDFAQLQPGREITARVHSRRSDFEYWIDEVRPVKGP
jgi:Cu/Ag efflux protein CusF